MNKRPLSITLLSWLFILAGVIGIVYHANELNDFSVNTLGVLVVRLLAIVGGVFALRGANWARWLLLAWIAFHVVLSIFHTTTELIIHILFLAVVIYVFFLSKEAKYFRR